MIPVDYSHEMMDRAIELLNAMLEADKEALDFLFNIYAPCKKECADHIGFFQQEALDEEGNEIALIGPLGLINAVFDDPRYAIAAVYRSPVGAEKPEVDSEDRELVGFGIWDREQSIILDGGFSGCVGYRMPEGSVVEDAAR